MIFLSNPLIVLADDTEDLLNVYGLTLGDSTKSEIEREIEAIQKDIQNLEIAQQNVEAYNKVVQNFLDERNSHIEKTKDSIISYSKKNEQLAKQIGSELLSGDIKDILKYDSNIKRNNKTIDELIISLDFYSSDYSFKTYNGDIDGLNDKLKDARQVYIDSLDTYNLGDVKSIRFISDAKRVVLSKYGYRINPLNTSELRFHSGTDYECSEGSNVYALFNGEVIDTGFSKVIGNFITVQSGDNIKYLYCHLKDVFVSKGDLVNQYDLIALTGSTGTQCIEPSLHLSIYINGCSYNPDLLFENLKD